LTFVSILGINLIVTRFKNTPNITQGYQPKLEPEPEAEQPTRKRKKPKFKDYMHIVLEHGMPFGRSMLELFGQNGVPRSRLGQAYAIYQLYNTGRNAYRSIQDLQRYSVREWVNANLVKLKPETFNSLVADAVNWDSIVEPEEFSSYEENSPKLWQGSFGQIKVYAFDSDGLSQIYLEPEVSKEDLTQELTKALNIKFGSDHLQIMGGQISAALPLPEGLVETPLDNFLLDRIMKFREQGISRSYLIEGPPGTGKSIFARRVAQRIQGARSVLIDGETLASFAVGADNDNSQLSILLTVMRPDAVIIDDLDRAGELRAGMLAVLEHLRQRVPVTLLTVNRAWSLTGAAKRPGRVDDTFVVPPVGAAVAKALLPGYDDLLVPEVPITAPYDVEWFKKVWWKVPPGDELKNKKSTEETATTVTPVLNSIYDVLGTMPIVYIKEWGMRAAVLGRQQAQAELAEFLLRSQGENDTNQTGIGKVIQTLAQTGALNVMRVP